VIIHLPAELERLILDDAKRGPYRTVDEFLFSASFQTGFTRYLQASVG
jgi:hypothetical protein